VAVDLKVGVIGVHGQHVGQRLHGGIERHAVALVLEQRIQAAEHERPRRDASSSQAGAAGGRRCIFGCVAG
jgi:hypothetical protein